MAKTRQRSQKASYVRFGSNTTYTPIAGRTKPPNTSTSLQSRLNEMLSSMQRFSRVWLLASVAYCSGGANAYDRADYPHWKDLDGDGQDTRQEILIRDSQTPVTFGNDGRVDAGLWVCPYTGRVTRSPSALDVDHLVALGEIDAAGGDSWTIEQRTAFANDLDNLVAVYKGSNRSKGDNDAYLWLPPNIANCSWYLEARGAVWEKYGIEIDNDEKKSADFFADKCPLHEKGIKLNRVRRWLGTWFDGLF